MDMNQIRGHLLFRWGRVHPVTKAYHTYTTLDKKCTYKTTHPCFQVCTKKHPVIKSYQQRTWNVVSLLVRCPMPKICASIKLLSQLVRLKITNTMFETTNEL